jgi:hypothetical protein
VNINNFEEQVNKTILERGIDYFESGYITHLQNISSAEWLAEVEGNYGNYNVEIELDDKNNIDSYSCNCPFEGPICKHVVAVLLAIKEELNSPKLKTKTNPPEWENIIKNTPEQKLRTFLLDFAKSNREIQHELVVHLAKLPKEVNTAKYSSIVTQAFGAAEGRYGYIEYRDTYAAMRPIQSLLHKAKEHISKSNLYEAFSIVSAIAPQCIDVIEYIDDSNGECGGAINEAFELTGDILNANPDKNLANIIFDWLFEQVQNPNYNDYGCGDDLEPLFFSWVNNQARFEIAYQLIDEQIDKAKKEEGWSSQYKLIKYLKHKVELLTREGKQAEADQVIEENLYLSDFRQMRIKEAISRNDIETAIAHINMGIDQAKKDNYPGTVHSFKDMLLEIFNNENNTENIRWLAKELFMENTNSINYYKTYKSTFSPDEWDKPCEEIIQELAKTKKRDYWGSVFSSDLAAVYIEESMWENLFKEVKNSNNINVLEKYLQYLAPHYPNQLIPIYESAIQKFAEQTGRNIYATLVGYLKNMARLKGGDTVAKELMLALLEKYKNRPAMKEEFKKLKW